MNQLADEMDLVETLSGNTDGIEFVVSGADIHYRTFIFTRVVVDLQAGAAIFSSSESE